MKNQQRKKRLAELGAEALADALLELADRDDTADDLVERMVATPKESVRRFKSKLAALRRRRRFISYGQSSTYARQLETLMSDIKAGVDDPRTGVELVASFYEADEAVLGQCDDSGGSVGDVFRLDARDLFVSYASRCDDKEWMGELVLRLNREDHYGVRDVLLDSAIQYLPEPVVRTMIERLQKSADQETDKYRKRHWLFGVESLAKQLKDAPLFERTRIASWGKLSTAACVDIAQVYLDSGDPETALAWLEKIPEEESFQSYERNHLLRKVYTQLGRRDKQEEVAWKIFRSGRSNDSLEDLLAVIGEEQRQRVLSGEAKRILENEQLSYTDADFLIEINRMDEAEAYIRSRKDQLEGDFYGSLLPLAEAMDKDKRALVATLIYRALLDSILARARSKIYGHGVRYLKKLDKLAAAITDWEDITPHTSYLAELRQVHGRKHAFWSRYEK